MPIPFVGRLNPYVSTSPRSSNLAWRSGSKPANALNSTEYVALVGSFFLVGLEAIIRVLTLALRTRLPVVDPIVNCTAADPTQLPRC